LAVSFSSPRGRWPQENLPLLSNHAILLEATFCRKKYVLRPWRPVIHVLVGLKHLNRLERIFLGGWTCLDRLHGTTSPVDVLFGFPLVYQSMGRLAATRLESVHRGFVILLFVYGCLRSHLIASFSFQCYISHVTNDALAHFLGLLCTKGFPSPQ
jgi:hypothetical protein